MSSTSVGYKKLCEDDSFYGTFIFADDKEATENIQPKEMDYIACVYDNLWWIGLVDEIDHEQEDFEVKFIHSHGPTRNFSWPQREDKCWIPKNDILAIIDMPTTVTGRTYNIKDDDYDVIIQKFILIYFLYVI